MNLKIQALPAFEDNYIWLIVHPDYPEALVVDPGDARPVLEALQAQGLTLSGILITHKHNDHTGGVEELLNHFNVPVYGSKTENLPFITDYVAESKDIHIDKWPTFCVIEVPGHTLGHVAYLIESNLFCGDTLFGAGCGRLFEGTPAQMYDSLNKIKSLPDNTQIYCAHEYTLHNLGFAQFVEPDNKKVGLRIHETKKLIAAGKASVPSTLQLEKQTNPFLRCDQASLQASAEKLAGHTLGDEASVFTCLRERRNHW
jgi:hydroxyacylglutathione hydrolase